MKDTLDFARSVIASEITALKQISELLSEDFLKAVELILKLDASSRIVVAGMGKAGFIGQKLSATLSSLGFKSFFLHPADALHGDLGRCHKDDIALLLSNSGETSEILSLITPLKRLEIKIIAITSNKNSTLAAESRSVLELGKISEAEPLGLAPTASTAAMLALGDALAMTLAEKRGVSRDDFAQFHPGGDLGRALLKVDEIMRTGEMFCCVDKSTSLRDALHQLRCTPGRPGAAAILDTDRKLFGIFTTGDLLRAIDNPGEVNLLEVTVGDACGKSPKVVKTGALAQEAARLISTYKIDELIVVNSQQLPLGMIDIQDLLVRGIK